MNLLMYITKQFNLQQNIVIDKMTRCFFYAKKKKKSKVSLSKIRKLRYSALFEKYKAGISIVLKG